ncbi:MAG TPA: hypothetical protein VGJ57_11680, partial [Nitrospirales bacterium]
SETGFLVPRGSVSDLARKIALLITDEGLRQRMGELGRQHVCRRFSTSALVDRHERFYLSALAAGPRTRRLGSQATSSARRAS